MHDIQDPRRLPDPAAASAECARLHALTAASQAAQGPEAVALDAEIARGLQELLAPGHGDRLAAVFETAPTVAVYRHLWRLLVQCERAGIGAGAGDGELGMTLFALPIIVVAGLEGGVAKPATVSGILDDAAALGAILREHRALAGNLSFALANVLVSAASIDLPRLPALLAWRSLPKTMDLPRELEPAAIALTPGPETVHMRFLVGSALCAPGAELLADERVGAWGIPFTQALNRQLATPGVSVLALPRAPQSVLQALRQGRASQREVGAHIFASNAIRKLRASVGEPTAVISAHREPAVPGGGEVRLSLSSPFDSREAEGFRCPLYPLDRVDDVVTMLADLLAECRVTDVRVVPGVHPDRDPVTGLPLLFKADSLPQTQGIH